ncbi:MAC/perforin domain-containing protein [Sphingobacterium haloxyli]|uniref:Uncharacterized protein n=1 Tax=Sphingobacterium haloxyli TaxID=2100533 RepID=A0A2S9J0A8_9SPHI|nr:MAC/perforin domain-containing protein [Sphingobacterium haloxyli]PRD46217.1 hypothetical protein C5745_16565 [Sphingobacterium haloxyli]
MHTSKTKSIFPLALTVVIALTSCEKNTLNDPKTTNPETTEPETNTPTELKFLIKNLSDNKNTTDEEGYGDYNFLGFGYDVTGKHSHKTSIKEPVINTPSFAQDNSGSFDVLRVLNSSFKSIYATDAENFTKWLAEGTPNIGYFKGNITHPFPDTDPQEDQYIYGLYDSYIKYRRLTLYGRNSQLIPYLTTDFQADSKSLEPAELVKKYGTHVLLSLFTGAKFSLDYRAEYTGTERRNAVESSFRVALNDCFGLFSGFLDPIDSTAFKDVTNPTIAFEAIGGDPSKIFVDKTSISKPKVDRTEWAKTISEDNARFVYINGLENLLPIFDLIEDAEKKQEVEAYIDEYTKTSALTL